MSDLEYPRPIEVIHADLPDYKDDPEEYELEEHARPDEMLMLMTAKDTVLEILDSCEKASVLDLCCGTGLSLEAGWFHTKKR
ncbi:MAG: hypothetical protein NT070_23790 [Cyanobacteria bacterium]|nr:hypothetical protein [Cyanobacteriota bacterium]